MQMLAFCFTILIRISISYSAEMALVGLLFLFLREMHLEAPGWLTRFELLTLGFRLGHEVRVVKLSPASGSALGMESA